jgi:hypothetical protein
MVMCRAGNTVCAVEQIQQIDPRSRGYGDLDSAGSGSIAAAVVSQRRSCHSPVSWV